MILSAEQLLGYVGERAMARILSALGAPVADAIALRRTTATGRWIGFHTDVHTARTVQVSSCVNPFVFMLCVCVSPSLSVGLRVCCLYAPGHSSMCSERFSGFVESLWHCDCPSVYLFVCIVSGTAE